MTRFEDRQDEMKGTAPAPDGRDAGAAASEGLGPDELLTAYALGELDGDEHAFQRARVEERLAHDAAARAELDELRALAGELEGAFDAESSAQAADGEAADDALHPHQRAAIEAALAGGLPDVPSPPDAGASVAVRRRVWLAWVVPALAAAAVVVFVLDRVVVQFRPTAGESSPDFAAGAPFIHSLDGGGPSGKPDPFDSRQDRATPPLDPPLSQQPMEAHELAFEDTTDQAEAGRAGGGGHHNLAAVGRSATATRGGAQGPESVTESVTESVPKSVPKSTPAPAGPLAKRSADSLTPEMLRDLQALGYTGGGSGGGAGGAPARAAAAVPVGALPGRGALDADAEVADAVSAGEHGASRREYRYLVRPPTAAPGTELYDPIVEAGYVSPFAQPLSTFSIDVDSGSYSNVRRFLNDGQLPPKDAVRVEELVNYFRYSYAPPAVLKLTGEGAGRRFDLPAGEPPFAVHVDAGEVPWAPTHRLVRIAIQGAELPPMDRPASHLTFLVDVSGSMSDQDKLPLLVSSLKLLVRQLEPKDRVAIVTYAGNAGVALESTTCDEAGRDRIVAALDRLQSGGSTHGSEGIATAYRIARQGFVPGGTNRVILATDGDFNVGITSKDALQSLIEDSAKSGVFLTVLGFGTGNLKDGTAEMLADKGNGVYAYIDSLDEGRRVLVDQMGASLVTIAKDVKIQVEWNPGRVAAYRLIGYENRALAAQDFNDDRKDAGEIGAGHAVTALYDVVPVGVPLDAGTDPLKYQAADEAAPKPELVPSEELCTVKLRWKAPDADTSAKIELPFTDAGRTLGQSDPDFRFAAGVAEFGLLLRGSDAVRDGSWEQVLALAESGRGADTDGWRAEFVRLAKTAAALMKR